MTNCFKLFSLLQLYKLHCSCVAFLIFEHSHLMPKNQANFIRIFITPFHKIVSDLFPTMKYVKNVAIRNFEYWNLYDLNEDISNSNNNNGTVNRTIEEKKQFNEQQRELMVLESQKKLNHKERGESDESVARNRKQHVRGKSDLGQQTNLRQQSKYPKKSEMSSHDNNDNGRKTHSHSHSPRQETQQQTYHDRKRKARRASSSNALMRSNSELHLIRKKKSIHREI